MKKFVYIGLAVAVPLGLIGLGIAVSGSGAGWFKPSQLGSRWLGAQPAYVQPGNTYAVWISQAHVSDRHRDGSDWDSDGSGPDIWGALEWRGIRILETEAGKDNLVVQWDSVNMDLKEVVLKGRLSAGQMQNVGLIRPEAEDQLMSTFYDADTFGAESLGGASWAVTGMVEGVNVFISVREHAEIKSFDVAVVRADLGSSPPVLERNKDPFNITNSVEWIASVPSKNVKQNAEDYSKKMGTAMRKGINSMNDFFSAPEERSDAANEVNPQPSKE